MISLRRQEICDFRADGFSLPAVRRKVYEVQVLAIVAKENAQEWLRRAGDSYATDTVAPPSQAERIMSRSARPLTPCFARRLET
jgi:hypothetical protein